MEGDHVVDIHVTVVVLTKRDHYSKQGRCNEGFNFNAEPIAFEFCILHFEFKFPAKNSKYFRFWFRQKFWARWKFYDWAKILGWVKNLCSGENFGFGRKFWFRVKILGLG